MARTKPAWLWVNRNIASELEPEQSHMLEFFPVRNLPVFDMKVPFTTVQLEKLFYMMRLGAPNLSHVRYLVGSAQTQCRSPHPWNSCIFFRQTKHYSVDIVHCLWPLRIPNYCLSNLVGTRRIQVIVI